MLMDPSNPLAFFILALLAAVVLAGAFFFFREIVASGVELAEQRKFEREQKRKRERN